MKLLPSKHHILPTSYSANSNMLGSNNIYFLNAQHYSIVAEYHLLITFHVLSVLFIRSTYYIPIIL